MKMPLNKFAIVSTIGLSFVFLSDACHAMADGPDKFIVRNVAIDDVLHIRKEPNHRSFAVGSIPANGNNIDNLGCVRVFSGKIAVDSDMPSGNRWCKIKYNGIVGWVSGRYLGEQ